MKKTILFTFIIVVLLSVLSHGVNASLNLNNSLVSYYKLDDSSGAGTVVDSLGNNNLVVNGTTLGVSGKINTAANFSGSGDYLEKYNSIIGLNSVDNISVNFWMNIPNADPYDNPVEIWDSNANHELQITFLNSTSITGRYYDGITSSPYVSVDYSSYFGSWTMITLTSSSTNGLKMYINGVLVGSAAQNNNGFSPNYIILGNADYRARNRGINGKMDEAAIWNRVLNSSEIFYLYNGGEGLSYPFNNNNFILNAIDSVTSNSINNFSVGMTNGSVVYNYTTNNSIIHTNITLPNSDLWNITFSSPYYYNRTYYNQNLNTGVLVGNLTHYLKPTISLSTNTVYPPELSTIKVYYNVSYNNQYYNINSISLDTGSYTTSNVSHATIVNSENTTEEYNYTMTSGLSENNGSINTVNFTVNYQDYTDGTTSGTTITINKSINYTNVWAYYPLTLYYPKPLVDGLYVNPQLRVVQLNNNAIVSFHGYLQDWNGTNETINLTSKSTVNNGYNYTNKINVPLNNSDFNIKITPYITVEYNGISYNRSLTSFNRSVNKARIIISTSPPNSSYYNYLTYNDYIEEQDPSLTPTTQYMNGIYYFVINNTKNYAINYTFNPNTSSSNKEYLYVYPTWITLNLTDYSNIYFYQKYNNTDITYARYYWTPTCTQLTNKTNSINLYSFGNANQLTPTDGIVGQITVKDSSGNTISNGILKILKQQSNGNYQTVEVTKTDDSGIAVARLIQYRSLYKFIIEENCKTIFTSKPTQIYSTSFNIQASNTTSTNLGLNSTIFNNLNYNITSTSTTYTLNYNTNNALNGQNCLYYYEYAFPTYTLKNSSCTTSTAGTIILPQDNNTKNRVDYYYDNVLIDSLSNNPTSLNQNLNNAGGIFVGVIFTFLLIGLTVYFQNIFLFFITEPIMLIMINTLGFINISIPVLYGFSFSLFIIGLLGAVRRWR